MQNYQSQIAALRVEVNAFKHIRPHARRYPDSLKVRTVELLRQGISAFKLSQLTGLNDSIINYWNKNLTSSRRPDKDPVDKAQGHLLPVNIVTRQSQISQPVDAVLTVRTPHGLLIEGLSVSDVAELVPCLERDLS